MSKSRLEGIIEAVKGKTRQVVGALSNNDRLQKQGEARAHKAAGHRDVAAKEARASKARLDEADEAAHESR
jgi:uncharacterized protein YjbJ (UPF0337 family)